MNHPQQIILNGIEPDQFLESVRQIVRTEVRSEFQQLPKSTSDKKYLSVTELSQFIDQSTQTIYNGTSKNEIPHLKRGGKLLFDRQEIIKWLEEGKRPVRK